MRSRSASRVFAVLVAALMVAALAVPAGAAPQAPAPEPTARSGGGGAAPAPELPSRPRATPAAPKGGVEAQVVVTSIAGTVTDTHGAPLEGVEVWIEGFSDTEEWVTAYVDTLADGSYEATSRVTDPDTDPPGTAPLPAGTYDVSFYKSRYSEESTEGVVVAAGQQRTVNATLTPYAGIEVAAWDETDPGLQLYAAYSILYRKVGGKLVQVGWLYGDSYTPEELPPGDYYVWTLTDGYVPEFWKDSATLSGATTVTVASETIVTLDQTLTPVAAKGDLQIHVSSAIDEPLDQVRAGVFRVTPDGNYLGELSFGDYLDANGDLTVALDPGDYRVDFFDESYAHGFEVYQDRRLIARGTTVTVAGAGTTSISTTLGAAAGASGTLYDSNGDIAHVDGMYGEVTVYAWDSVESTWSAVQWSGLEGFYHVTEPLAPGTYRFGCSFAEFDFSGEDWTFTNHTAFYDGPTQSATNVGDATSVTIAEGEQRTGIDFFFDAFTNPEAGPPVRVAGLGRYETAAEVSNGNFDTSEVVVLATGENFADALSASGLCGAYYAPLLLTRTGALPEVIRDEIVRLQANEVIIVGGTGAVSDDVEIAVDALPSVTTTRIAGLNRFETAAKIARHVADVSWSYQGEAFVVRGDDFADALAASPIAVSSGMPILLTPKTYLHADTSAALEDLGVTEVVIAGGTGAVDNVAKGQIEGLGIGVTRIAGLNRYSTAAQLASWAVDNRKSNPFFVGVSTGLDYPDALGGGVAAGMNGGVLLMTTPTTLAGPAQTFLVDYCGLGTAVQVYGGTGAVSDTVMTQIGTALSQ